MNFAEYMGKNCDDPIGTEAALKLIVLWKEAYEIFQRGMFRGPFYPNRRVTLGFSRASWDRTARARPCE